MPEQKSRALPETVQEVPSFTACMFGNSRNEINSQERGISRFVLASKNVVSQLVM